MLSQGEDVKGNNPKDGEGDDDFAGDMEDVLESRSDVSGEVGHGNTKSSDPSVDKKLLDSKNGPEGKAFLGAQRRAYRRTSETVRSRGKFDTSKISTS